jgi:hypothetical protein
MYVNGQMKQFQEWGERGIKENVEGVSSSMISLIYCKNICKFQNVLPPSTTIKKYLENGKKKHSS